MHADEQVGTYTVRLSLHTRSFSFKLTLEVVSPSPLPLPQSVTKHVHDVQQSLDTQVPGKVIKLWKEQW